MTRQKPLHAWETRYKSCTVCLPVAAKAVDCDGLSLSAGLARSAIPANTSPWIIPNSGWESNATKHCKPLGNCQIYERNEKLQLLTENLFLVFSHCMLYLANWMQLAHAHCIHVCQNLDFFFVLVFLWKSISIFLSWSLFSFAFLFYMQSWNFICSHGILCAFDYFIEKAQYK